MPWLRVQVDLRRQGTARVEHSVHVGVRFATGADVLPVAMHAHPQGVPQGAATALAAHWVRALRRRPLLRGRRDAAPVTRACEPALAFAPSARGGGRSLSIGFRLVLLQRPAAQALWAFALLCSLLGAAAILFPLGRHGRSEKRVRG